MYLESHIIPDRFPQSNVDIRVELITEWILRGLETFHRTERTVTHAVRQWLEHSNAGAVRGACSGKTGVSG